MSESNSRKRYTLELSAISNQRFYTSYGNSRIDFELATFRGLTYVSIWIDDVNAIAGVKAISGTNLLPKGIAERLGGNFRFESNTTDFPYYENFNGTDCVLVFEES